MKTFCNMFGSSLVFRINVKSVLVSMRQWSLSVKISFDNNDSKR